MTAIPRGVRLPLEHSEQTSCNSGDFIVYQLTYNIESMPALFLVDDVAIPRGVRLPLEHSEQTSCNSGDFIVYQLTVKWRLRFSCTRACVAFQIFRGSEDTTT